MSRDCAIARRVSFDPAPATTGTRPATCSTVISTTRQCSAGVSVTASPVVPQGTTKSMPSVTCHSTNRRSAVSSTAPSPLNGVSNAVPHPRGAPSCAAPGDRRRREHVVHRGRRHGAQPATWPPRARRPRTLCGPAQCAAPAAARTPHRKSSRALPALGRPECSSRYDPPHHIPHRRRHGARRTRRRIGLWRRDASPPDAARCASARSTRAPAPAAAVIASAPTEKLRSPQ